MTKALNGSDAYEKSMNLVRRGILLTFAIAAVGFLLFNMAWYMMAFAMPMPLQGLVMVTAALLIAFSCVKAARGTKPVFPARDDTKGLSMKASIILLVLFLATIFIVPAFVLRLMGA